MHDDVPGYGQRILAGYRHDEVGHSPDVAEILFYFMGRISAALRIRQVKIDEVGWRR